MRALIAYFSRADENYFSGTLRRVKVGNTEIAAELLEKLTGADRFKIDPIQPYSPGYNACIAEAQDDQRRDARPELKEYPDSLDGYDAIYLGYPNYWGTMPMAVFPFLERFDLSGKTLCPFCTHEGSGMGHSEADIRRLCPGATVKHGLAIHGSSAANAGPALKQWIERINQRKEYE